MSAAKLNVAVNNMACVMNLTVLLPYLLRIVLGPLPIEVIVIIIVTIKSWSFWSSLSSKSKLYNFNGLVMMIEGVYIWIYVLD